MAAQNLSLMGFRNTSPNPVGFLFYDFTCQAITLERNPFQLHWGSNLI